MKHDGADEGPSLIFPLEEDLNRKDQLFSFRKEKEPIVTDKAHKPGEQQLLQEGKLGDTEFSARLQKVVFGSFEGQPACLLVVQVDFVPKKNRGFFRFRNAIVEVEFEDVDHGADESMEDDDDDEEDYHGPVVCKFDPGLIRGHLQTAAESYNIQFQVPLAPVSGAAISMGRSVTSPREGLHLVHGRLMGDPPTRVKWIINENEMSKSGIYEQPIFATVLRHGPGRPFTMAVNIKATTYGGRAVKGKKGSRITFKPPKEGFNGRGGSIQVGSKSWAPTKGAKSSRDDLSSIDLQNETRMLEKLLNQQAPGGGPGVILGVPAAPAFDFTSLTSGG